MRNASLLAVLKAGSSPRGLSCLNKRAVLFVWDTRLRGARGGASDVVVGAAARTCAVYWCLSFNVAEVHPCVPCPAQRNNPGELVILISVTLSL